MLPVERLMGVFILLAAGMLVGLIILGLEWLTFKYGVPYWRKRQSRGWMFCSQVENAYLHKAYNIMSLFFLAFVCCCQRIG